MKAIMLFLVTASLCSMRLFAQDTLYTKSGSVVNAKVVEIGQGQIKYKKASNPDGPLYVMNTSDLVLIHFKNGSKEVFSSSDNQTGNSGQNNSSNGNQPTVINNYSSFPSYGRPGVNVVVTPVPYWGYNPWWRWGVYRPFYGYGGYYHHNYGGGYYHGGGHYGGHYGHHR